jgi:hypothetical protein
MSKSVSAKSFLNPEFVARTSAIYGPAGFVRRAKGGRKPKDALPLFLFSDDFGKPGFPYGAQLLGQAPGYNEHGGELMFNLYAVTAADGLRYAAYQRTGGEFNICQDFNYVAEVK